MKHYRITLSIDSDHDPDQFEADAEAFCDDFEILLAGSDYELVAVNYGPRWRAEPQKAKKANRV